MNYSEALAWLDSHYSIEAVDQVLDNKMPSLGRMQRVMAHLGDCHRSFRSVHVTGTNGKGSTAQIIASLLRAHGLRVGLGISPHLEQLEERLSIDGVQISSEELANSLTRVRGAEERAGVDANYFEVLIAAQFDWFARRAIDVGVIEVGAGGRFDATNVIESSVSVVTNVALDHAELFGPDLVDIAVEKSGIAKEGSTLVLGPISDDLLDPFESSPASTIWRYGYDFVCTENAPTASGRHISVTGPRHELKHLGLPLFGEHQGVNAACAIAASDAFLGERLDPARVRSGLVQVRNPGRFEVLSARPCVVVDGAHNPAGAVAASTARREYHVGHFRLVVGMNRGRDAREMLSALEAPVARDLFVCAACAPKAMSAHDIADAATSLGATAVICGSVAEAVARALDRSDPNDLVMVAGSLYVVGEARRFILSEFIETRTER